MNETSRGSIAVTPGLFNVLGRGGARMSDRACADCGLGFPVYRGRYPSACPKCGGTVARKEPPKPNMVSEAAVSPALKALATAALGLVDAISDAIPDMDLSHAPTGFDRMGLLRTVIRRAPSVPGIELYLLPLISWGLEKGNDPIKAAAQTAKDALEKARVQGESLAEKHIREMGAARAAMKVHQEFPELKLPLLMPWVDDVEHGQEPSGAPPEVVDAIKRALHQVGAILAETTENDIMRQAASLGGTSEKKGAVIVFNFADARSAEDFAEWLEDRGIVTDYFDSPNDRQVVVHIRELGESRLPDGSGFFVGVVETASQKLANDITLWALGKLAKEPVPVGMPRGGDRAFWAGEMLNVGAGKALPPDVVDDVLAAIRAKMSYAEWTWRPDELSESLPVVAVSRVPRLQALIEAGAEGDSRGDRTSRARIVSFGQVAEVVDGGVQALKLFLEGPAPSAANRYYRLEGPQEPVLVFEFLENELVTIFATDAPSESLGFDPRAELIAEASRIVLATPDRAVTCATCGQPTIDYARTPNGPVCTACLWAHLHPDMKPQPISEEVVEPKNSLGVPRDQMPQIDGDQMDAFLAELRAKGIAVIPSPAPARLLLPTQGELDSEKVDSFADAADDMLKKRIVVAMDWRILDGHHRWAALLKKDPEANIETIQVQLPINELLDLAREFAGARFREVEESAGDEIGLWRYGKISGYWKLERMCSSETAAQWLAIFQKDEPTETFVLSKRKPTKLAERQESAAADKLVRAYDTFVTERQDEEYQALVRAYLADPADMATFVRLMQTAVRSGKWPQVHTDAKFGQNDIEEAWSIATGRAVGKIRASVVAYFQQRPMVDQYGRVEINTAHIDDSRNPPVVVVSFVREWVAGWNGPFAAFIDIAERALARTIALDPWAHRLQGEQRLPNGEQQTHVVFEFPLHDARDVQTLIGSGLHEDHSGPGGAIRGSRPSSGRGATRAHGGFRFELGAARKTKVRRDVRRSIQNRINARRGVASRIAAAKKWHQSAKGRQYHRDLGRYNQKESTLARRIAALERLHAVLGESFTYNDLPKSVDDIFDGVLQKLIAIEAVDVLQDVNFTDAGSIYLYFDPLLHEREVQEILSVIVQAEGADQACLVAVPNEEAEEDDAEHPEQDEEPADWWVIFVPTDGPDPEGPEPELLGASEPIEVQAPAPTIAVQGGQVNDIVASLDIDAMFAELTGNSSPAPAPAAAPVAESVQTCCSQDHGLAPTGEGSVLLFWSSREDRTPKFEGIASGVAGQKLPSLREAAARGEGVLFAVRAHTADEARATINSGKLSAAGPNCWTNLNDPLAIAKGRH